MKPMVVVLWLGPGLLVCDPDNLRQTCLQGPVCENLSEVVLGCEKPGTSSNNGCPLVSKSLSVSVVSGDLDLKSISSMKGLCLVWSGFSGV